MLAIDSSVDRKVKLREVFDISEGKELPIVKHIRRRYMITITTMIDEIFNLDFKIDQLNKKRERLSNDTYNIKSYKYKLKEILKEGNIDGNRVEFGLEDRI